MINSLFFVAVISIFPFLLTYFAALFKIFENKLLQESNISGYLAKFEDIIINQVKINNELKFKKDLKSLLSVISVG